MFFQFRPCTFEMDYEAYMRFLLQHHEELNLPYPFPVKLGFMSSPLIFGSALLLIAEESYEIAGAAGFVYGTGPNQYEDRHVCQVEVAFLRREYRRASLFAQGLQVLLGQMKAGNPDIEQVQFWVPEGQAELEKLFSKLSGLPGANRFRVNGLTCHQIPFRELEAYAHRFETRLQAEQRAV